MNDGTREEEPPTHYLRQDKDGSGTQVWRIQDTEAVRLGVSNPEQGAGTYIKRGKRAKNRIDCRPGCGIVAAIWGSQFKEA